MDPKEVALFLEKEPDSVLIKLAAEMGLPAAQKDGVLADRDMLIKILVDPGKCQGCNH